MQRTEARVLCGVCGFLAGTLAAGALASAGPTQAGADEAGWIRQSNALTQRLLDVQLEHAPEQGSHEGLARFDTRISQPTLADQLAQRRELETVLARIEAERPRIEDEKVQQDVAILRKAFDVQFRADDYALAHEVPFLNASETVFEGVRGLLDDQVAADRRAAAVVRLQKYAGAVSGYAPYTTLLRQRELEQMNKPGVLFPSKSELETELGRDSNYVEGIPALFEKYGVTGWQTAYAQLKVQLTEYDAWVRSNILPRARTDFRLPPERYTLAFEQYGIDLPPAQIATLAHTAFAQYQHEMAPLAAQIAGTHHYASTDPQSVIAQLKRQQVVGDAILPLYRQRLSDIENIIRTRQLVTLPARAAIIRLATAAETAQEPAPHMSPPPFLHNTGQRGEFVLPLNIPGAAGADADRYDDFTTDAVAWTLTAHEARPGHELQFDSMVEQGVSLARSLYAFNSTNAEGWGLYAEYLMQPFEPVEGQLFTLQLRLLRAARAFLDPELQSGAIGPAQAYDVLEKQVGLSHAFAKEEVERFTYRAPGQANSYFYGYTRLLALRKETETALGAKFDQRRFHDFLLSQGLLPPDLMREAVLQDFIPSQLR